MNAESKAPSAPAEDNSERPKSALVAAGWLAWLTPYRVIVGLICLLFALALIYVFTARSVAVSVKPFHDELSLSGGLVIKLGGRYLLRPGDYQVQASAAGYQPLDTDVAGQ